MTTDHELSGDHGSQLMLDGLGPQEGTTYRNRHTHAIGTVVRVTRRRYAWVTIRADGSDSDMPLAWLSEHWQPCRPDGTLL